MTHSSSIAAMTRSAMLVSVRVSLYTGRKQDKQTQEEVTNAKGSGSKRASSVYKNLFADCKELEDIVKFQARARVTHYSLTLPWDDYGTRLLPAKAFMEYKAAMNLHQQQFDELVAKFLDKYETLVAAAAFKLGALFDRDEYPEREKVARKFAFDIAFTPVPSAGDFRVDMEREVQDELAQQYEKKLAQQLDMATRDAWSRLYEALNRIKERLTPEEDGTRKRFFDTTITNAQELCDVLTKLNVMNDPKLESARCQLEAALCDVSPKDVRESEGVRADVLAKVSSTLDAFDWGDFSAA
jgi:hypothetical protein